MLKRLAGMVYRCIEKLPVIDKMRQKIKKIYTCSDEAARKRCRELCIDNISKMLVVVVGSVVLFLILFVTKVSRSGDIILDRDGYGGDITVRTLQTEVDGEKTCIDVEVIPIEYSKEELKQAFDKGFEYIDKIYLGDNESADKVSSNLNLVTNIEDMGLQVSWISDDCDVVSSSGIVNSEDPDTDKIVNLTAVLSYGEDSSERNYQIRVVGRVLSAKENAARIISEYVKNIQNSDKGNAHIVLPGNIQGYKVEDNGQNSNAGVILLLGVIAAASIWAGVLSKLKNMERARKQQLMCEYPVLVDKLMLYLGAGITVKGAFARIAQSRKEAGEGDFLIREIRYMLNEIQSGVSESDAYYNMGHRINLPVYIKLMSMLSQNVKKGTKDILVMMAGEEQAAMQTRKELAKKKGEEAGTKLLFPMVVLLGVVMVIVILPAVMNF